jgi:hypothetical protein
MKIVALKWKCDNVCDEIMGDYTSHIGIILMTCVWHHL